MGYYLSVFEIRGHCGTALRRMVDRVAQHWRQVPVGERVEDVLRLTPSFDQTRREQRLQSRGYRRDLLALVLGELRNASLTRREPREKPEPFGIAERPEHLGSGFDL